MNIKALTQRKNYILIISYIFSVLIAIVVYNTGGTTKVYANLMYIPIATASSTNDKKMRIIHAVISALLVGPFMPLHTNLNIMQKPQNWIIRLIIYFLIASVIGLFSDIYKQEHVKNSIKEKEISEAHMSTIYSLVKLSECRDHNMSSHIERVASFCELLAVKLLKAPNLKSYINEDYIVNIYKASALHDIGKVGIPDGILLKPGKLSTEEFEIMKTHSTIGANMLIEVQKKYPDNKFLELGISITQFHHERWDGTGYPCGLSGEEIPLSARIMAIVDVYDALKSRRVYKEAYSHDRSLEIIKQSAGTQFDPMIVNAFVENEAEFNKIYEKEVANEAKMKTAIGSEIGRFNFINEYKRNTN